MEEINPEKLLIRIAAILEGLKLKYFVTGGFAISIWGRPRATFDIDVVIQLIEPDIEKLADALHKFSPKGYIDEEMMKGALTNKEEFNFIDGETGIKVDFWITKNDELSRLKLKRRKPKIINGQKVYFISPEDLILSKLEWYKKSESTRHLEDIESILKISGNNLDMQYLKKWADRSGFLKDLNKSLDRI